jgi:ATP-dependent DNA ligase
MMSSLWCSEFYARKAQFESLESAAGNQSASTSVSAASVPCTSATGFGVDLFAKACEFDLEGIVAKRKASLYRPPDKASRHWMEIKNPTYQAEGRQG